MEELIKILNLRQINYLHINYTDNDGNFKEITIDYPNEKLCADLLEKASD